MTLVAVPESHSLSVLRPAWMDFALCKGKTDLFFGPPGERPSKRRKRETLARAYCNVCPVAEPCRDAGRTGRENGMWGSENEEERASAGFAPKATERRSVARAAREARRDGLTSGALDTELEFDVQFDLGHDADDDLDTDLDEVLVADFDDLDEALPVSA